MPLLKQSRIVVTSNPSATEVSEVNWSEKVMSRHENPTAHPAWASKMRFATTRQAWFASLFSTSFFRPHSILRSKFFTPLIRHLQPFRGGQEIFRTDYVNRKCSLAAICQLLLQFSPVNQLDVYRYVLLSKANFNKLWVPCSFNLSQICCRWLSTVLTLKLRRLAISLLV